MTVHDSYMYGATSNFVRKKIYLHGRHLVRILTIWSACLAIDLYDRHLDCLVGISVPVVCVAGI